MHFSVKWNGRKFDDIAVDTEQPILFFQEQLYHLTGVDPKRQKILIKGNLLKNDLGWNNFVLTEGMTLMMIGSADKKVEQVSATSSSTESSTSSLPNRTTEENNILDIQEKLKKIGYIEPCGLTNLGNTCYLNASLQCLRRLPELQACLKLNNSNAQPSPLNVAASINDSTLKNQLVGSLTTLLDEMHHSKTKAVTPLALLQIFRLIYPQFNQMGEHGIHAQQDAEECFTSLIQTLKDFVVPGNKPLKEEMKFGDLFTGQYSSITKCLGNKDEEPIQSTESFTKLSVHISQTTNHLSSGIKESLVEKFEKTSVLSNQQEEYEKTSSINVLPPYLMIHFIRFFWKHTLNVKAKIMKKVSFPLTLDMYSFCSSSLQAQLAPSRARYMQNRNLKDANDKPGKAETAEASAGIKASEKEGERSRGILGPTGFYDLIAVLTHIGRDADGGHYISWIRDDVLSENAIKDSASNQVNLPSLDESSISMNPKKAPISNSGAIWWKYDDDRITAVQDTDILRLDGGGDWHTAYLCIYREAKS